MSDKDTSIRDVISDWDSVFADAVSKSILFEEYVDFSRKGLALGLVRDHRKALIIGDSPVIFYRPTDCDIRYEPKSEIYMPVAKDVVLFIAGGDGYRSVIPIENTTVDDINHIVALQSTVIASQSRKLSAAIQKRLTK